MTIPSAFEIQNETLGILGTEFHEIRKEWDTQKEHDALTIEKMKKIETALDQQHTLLQKMHIATLRPPLGNTDLPDPTKDSFSAYLRKGLEMSPDLKMLSVSNPSEGGYLVPQGVSNRIHSLLTEESIFRKIASVTSISNDAIELLIDKGQAGVGWAQEKEERPETETPELTKMRIPVHELYARPRATQQLLDDACMNIETWLAEKISTQMAEAESAAFVSGDGKGKPRGFLTYEHSADFQWGHLQGLKTGQNGAFPAEYPENCLIDLFHLLKPAYLKDAVWIMSRSVQASIRKLKDPVHHQPLWQPTLSNAFLPTFMGFPVYITDHMPALHLGTASCGLVFGNFKQGYHIVERQNLHILRDPYSAKPYVEFYTTKRVGGDVVNFEALKVLDLKA